MAERFTAEDIRWREHKDALVGTLDNWTVSIEPWYEVVRTRGRGLLGVLCPYVFGSPEYQPRVIARVSHPGGGGHSDVFKTVDEATERFLAFVNWLAEKRGRETDAKRLAANLLKVPYSGEQ